MHPTLSKTQGWFDILNMETEEFDAINGFSIGLTPSAFLNRWAGYQGKVSYAYKNLELEINAGYLAGVDNDEKYSGYRFRPLLKYYILKSRGGITYFGVGWLLRKLNIEASGSFSSPNTMAVQELEFDIDQTMSGAYLSFGNLYEIEQDKFYFDLGIGLGTSRVNTNHQGIPDDAELIYEPEAFEEDTRSRGVTQYPIVFGHCAFIMRI